MQKIIRYIGCFLAALTICGCSCVKREVEKKELAIRHIGRFSRVFNDMNKEHLAAAKKWGVPEVDSREDAKKHRWQLKEIESCDLYKIDSLTHSIPFLVPRAKDMLEEIGQNFQDSLTSRGVGGSYQVVVTSVLRSNADIRKLRRGNSNASKNSAHRYGTTVDIAYARFNRIDDEYPHDIPSKNLKNILAEVLRDMKNEKKCYVKYEVRQGCFHITVR